MLRLITALCIFTFKLSASAQEQPKTSPSAQPYMPDLAVVMTVTQLRHFKLFYAVEVGNWMLANYEVGLVRNSLVTAAKLYPVYEHVEQAKLIEEISKPALEAIEKSINEKNRAAFKKPFMNLTDTCNSCHQQANLGFIVIRVPTRSPFSNEDHAGIAAWDHKKPAPARARVCAVPSGGFTFPEERNAKNCARQYLTSSWGAEQINFCLWPPHLAASFFLGSLSCLLREA